MPKTIQLGARLVELQAQVVTAKQRQRECEREHRSAVAEIGRLRDAAIDAYAVGDDALAKKASAERDKAEGAPLREAAERAEGADRAVAKAEADLGIFASENADGLLAERTPGAVAAAQAVEDAVEALVSAEREWQATYAGMMGLLRISGRSTDGLPAFPPRLVGLVREAKRAGNVDVPPPLLGAVARERTQV